MRNTRKSGQILRSKKRPHPTLRNGRGSRTNSNTSYQIQARVIEADGASAVWVPDPRSAQLIQPGAAAAREVRGNIMRALRALVVVGLIAITGWTPTCAAERVDLLLVLAADVSGSMDESKFDLQRSRYAAAFSDSRVIEAIRGGPGSRIAVAFIEWSGILQQRVVIDWTVISNDETARQFGDHILEAPRAFARNSTSIP